MPASLTIEAVEARFPEMKKGQVWYGVDAKYWFLCEVHGKYLQSFDKHGRGQGCKKCGRERTTQAQLLTIEEAETRCHDMIKGQTWTTSKDKYRFMCKSHGEYFQGFTDHCMSKGCKKCATERLVQERLIPIEEAEERFPEMVKGQTWNGSHSKYWFTCNTHGKYLQAFTNHDGGQGCRRCGKERVAQAQRITVKEAYMRCPNMVQGQVWKGQKYTYEFRCTIEQHGVYTQRFGNHYRQGSGCPQCRSNVPLTIGEAEARYPEMVKGQIWTRALDKYWFLCGDHGAYLQAFSLHNSGAGCRVCKESKGERAVGAYLSPLVTFTRQQTFPGLGTARAYRFDFCVPDAGVLIEYHGQQHYEKWYFDGESDEGLKERQDRDRIKEQWAKDNGWHLIVVPYWEKDIQAFLDKELEKIGSRAA